MTDVLRSALFSGAFGPNGTVSAFTNFTVSASTSGWGAIFQPWTADAITHLGFRYGARAGTPPTFSMRLEGVDASGNPDGSDVGGGSATAKTFTPPADATWDGTWQWIALTNSYTPTRGQFLASTIRYSSGTIDGSNNSSFSRTAPGLSAFDEFPYTATMTASAWTKINTAGPVFGWRTASGRFGFIAQSNYNTNTANTATHQSGMYFTVPAAWGTSYQVVGLAFYGRIAAAAGSAKVNLYQTDGTLLQSTTIDGDHMAAAGGTGGFRIVFQDTNLATLTTGTKYYAVIEVVSGVVGIKGFNIAEAGDASAFANGINRGLVTNAGSYSETTTVMPICELILDGITVPSGSGGGGYVIGA